MPPIMFYTYMVLVAINLCGTNKLIYAISVLVMICLLCCLQVSANVKEKISAATEEVSFDV